MRSHARFLHDNPGSSPRVASGAVSRQRGLDLRGNFSLWKSRCREKRSCYGRLNEPLNYVWSRRTLELRGHDSERRSSGAKGMQQQNGNIPRSSYCTRSYSLRKELCNMLKTMDPFPPPTSLITDIKQPIRRQS